MKGVGLRLALALGATAAALAIAAALLDGFTVTGLSFVVAVVVFSAVGLVTEPLVSTLLERHARAVAGLASLAVTFVTLLVTDLVSDGIEVEGALAWILGTVVVWLALLAFQAVSGVYLRRRLGAER
ncbi:MAG TPA: phage holin family protein [Gaiellaceae bacterium]|nr:phage holin family protein [Gaiellaceae bacterium]